MRFFYNGNYTLFISVMNNQVVLYRNRYEVNEYNGRYFKDAAEKHINYIKRK